MKRCIDCIASKYPPAEPEALWVAGPSKGPYRDPKSKSQAPSRNADGEALESRNILRELSNSCSLPGRAGGSPVVLGCGPGFPITEVLVAEGLNVFGVDAPPSFVQAFRRNLPNTPVVCEAVQDSRFFDRAFDGVLAWGLMFLLCPEDQRRLIQRIADIMVPGGRLLFTSPAEPLVWNDAMTGLESRSLGAEEYRKQLSAVALSVSSEYEDEGQNHYFDAFKERIT